MIKRFICLLMVVVFTLMSLIVTGSACTGFAVYSDKTWYGMNFDHYIDDIRFYIRNSDENGAKIFSMDFYSFNDYNPTVSMNNLGLFSSCQLVYPAGIKSANSGENQVDMYEVFVTAPYVTDKVQDIRDFIGDVELVCQYNYVHNLHADLSGDAMVLETRDGKTWMTDIEGKSIVMTNFFSCTIEDSGDQDVSGIGADRYVKAKEYIDGHTESFSFDDGMAALQETAQKAGSYPTQCSMLFDPANSEVYIVLKSDFERVWKVSINNGAVETCKGFKNQWHASIGGEGIHMKELLAFKDEAPAAVVQESGESDKAFDPLWFLVPIGLLAVLGVAARIALRRRKKSVK